MEFLATQEYVKITGRTLWVDGVRYLSYSGSSICFSFVGKKAEAVIISDSPEWEEILKGWIAIYINDEKEPRKRICLDAKKETYLLYESDIEEHVTITIMKYSEAAFGSCGICLLRTDTKEIETPKMPKHRKIEIIGDSITCGYGVEAENELQIFTTTHENPTKSYSMRTIEACNAEGHLVSWSGIGMISNWVPEDAKRPEDSWLMPMLYQYTDASISKRLYGEERSAWEKWDFTQFVPDIILINIGTNDASFCKDLEERQEQYVKEYDRFVDFVAKKNPSSQILCMLGTMDQRLCNKVEKVVNLQQDKAGNRVHYLHLPLQDSADGLGADFHPSAVTQEKTAQLVAAEVKKIMGW